MFREVLINLDPTFSGCISDVSPFKLYKDKRRRYFSFAVLGEHELHRGFCFSPKKLPLFEQNANDTSSNKLNI